MKFRFIFLALGLLALGATITGGAVYFQTVNALIHDQERKGTQENIEHLDKDLSSMINTTQNAVTVLAKMWSVQNFFNTQRPETTADVYLALDDFREAYGATRCCLINREGRVIAASSDNAQVQIGDDYSLQPFFPKTLAGKRVTSLTQGVSGQEPAINLSHPIFFKDRVLGVALLTVPLVNIEEELVSHATGLVALTDEHNFVFASNRRGWRFKLMGAATADDLAALAKNRPLMGEAPLQVPLTFNKVKGTAHAPNGKKYLFSRTPLSSTPGWQINYFQEEDRTKARLRQALFGKTGMLLAGMTLFIFGAIAYLFRQAELFLRQREEAEQKVKSANLFLAQILDVAADGMRIVDNNCNIVRINKTFAAMTGMDKEDILGKKCHEISWSPYCNKKKCPLQQIRAGKKRVEYESAQESPTGKIINCWIIAVPLHDINGTFIGILESFRDITEKLANELAMEKAFSEAHTLAEELAASNDQLHRQQRNLALAHDTLKQSQAQILQQEKMASVGQLAAGVAHEINNPMGFIGSNLSSLAKYLERITEFIRALEAKLPQEPPDEELAALRKKLKIDYIMDDALHLVEESLDGADRVKKIVQGLKNFSRVDQAERVAADINECLDSTLNIVWNELKYKCEVKKEYGELPPTVCNPQQLNQMFMNLLVNAAQAIETRGEIKIKTWGDQDWIYTRISDTGSGIPEDKIKRIFEPFYTSKEVGKGTGLGLSIVYDIVVKNHHGDIQVESEVGKGTSFTVKIPLIVAEPPEK